MEYLNREEARQRMNRYGAGARPFMFVIDYAMQACVVLRTEEVDPERLRYAFGSRTNFRCPASSPQPLQWHAFPVSVGEYRCSFDRVMAGLRRGDSYLVNLTCATPVECTLSLEEIFCRTQAPYKLWFDDRFVVFSPETFVRISADGTLSSYPMKGTTDASVPNAEAKILADRKEAAEHATIVDLIRNDLSGVASDVHVARYRYTEKVETHRGPLIQVSSEVQGRLGADFRTHLGDILFSLLPAGSVTGAPKCRTLEIIREAENYERGYYTGVCGIFDGRELDSGVMIRFLERNPDGGYLFKSGGGITALSDCESEYREMKQKIYVPLY